jgi:GNAT superfamily N-acetyltransferase
MTDRMEIHLGGSTFDNAIRRSGFKTYHEWNDEIAEELVEQSKEPLVMSSTPRDFSERFSSVEAANEWYEKADRSVYSLRSSSGLAGIFWLSKESYESADETMAIRLYEIARGKGLAVLFGKTALYHNERWLGYKGDVWLETGINNYAAQSTFERLSFVEINDENTAPHRLKMVRSGVATRDRIQRDQQQKHTR